MSNLIPELQIKAKRPDGREFTWQEDLMRMMELKRYEEVLKMVGWMIRKLRNK